VKVAPKAASDALLSTQIQAAWCDVTDIGYSRHEKPGKPASLAAALNALGGHDSAAGSCAWYVVGLEMSVREWAMRQGWGGRPVPPPQAQGMLVATLSVLAGHFGLVGRQRAA
jgi:hypothetical protein